MCFLFKQKTANEMRISDWSSDVCSSDLASGIDQITYDCEGDERDAEWQRPPQHRHVAADKNANSPQQEIGIFEERQRNESNKNRRSQPSPVLKNQQIGRAS